MPGCNHIDSFTRTINYSGFFGKKKKQITEKIPCKCSGFSGQTHWGKTNYEQRWVYTSCDCGHSESSHY